MPRNALRAAGQNQWLNIWQNRQRQNNPNWNESWAPKAGWRGRFNRSQQQPVNSQPHNPGQPQPEGPRVPANTPGVPYAPPAPPRPLGWRTLAPTNVTPGGWGGGAIEYEAAPPGPQGVSMLAPPDTRAVDPYYLPGYGPGEPGYRPRAQSRSAFGQPSPRTNAMMEY